MENYSINKMKASFPNTGEKKPFQDVLLTVNNAADEMNMVLECTYGFNRVEYQIDVVIACEVLLQIARESLQNLPVPENIMEISIQTVIEKKVAEMTDDLYPPVLFL